MQWVRGETTFKCRFNGFPLCLSAGWVGASVQRHAEQHCGKSCWRWRGTFSHLLALAGTASHSQKEHVINGCQMQVADETKILGTTLHAPDQSTLELLLTAFLVLGECYKIVLKGVVWQSVNYTPLSFWELEVKIYTTLGETACLAVQRQKKTLPYYCFHNSVLADETYCTAYIMRYITC